MSRAKTAALLGLFVGLAGGVLGLTSLAAALEEEIGLNWMFALRGAVQPPADVVIVALDEFRAQDLPPAKGTRDWRTCIGDTQRVRSGDWPRCVYTHLIDSLSDLGVSTIVFDVAFDEHKSPDHDRGLTVAIERTSQIVILERLVVEKLPDDRLVRETLVRSIPAVREAATGTGPFPLPKVPVRVNQFWAFKTSIGDTPTLPVVVLQVHALSLLDRFLFLVGNAGSGSSKRFQSNFTQPKNANELEHLMRDLRRAFREDRQLYDRFMEALAAERNNDLDVEGHELLASLARVYSGSEDYHFNFYGPAGTIPRISGVTVLEQRFGGGEPNDLALDGKIAFVGVQDLYSPEQKDGFYTVFSRDDGVDLSGVEIAATAFANLLTGRTLDRLSNLIVFLIIVVFGGVIGAIAFMLPGLRALTMALVLGGGYCWLSQALFQKEDLWMPIMVPLLAQIPAALLLGLTLQYLVAKRQRDNVARAIRYYVPGKVVESLERGDRPAASSEVINGICLSTDAEHYTSVSEELDPQQLAVLMNEYYEALTAPVLRRDGTVLEIAADSAMCLWVAQAPDRMMRRQACLAALDMQRSVTVFNERHGERGLPTRIGLHIGRVAVGNIGGGGHYAYGLTGDIANTTSRIESLNKHLGTWVLASESVVGGLDDLLLRRVGFFALMGKTQPVPIFEILGERNELGLDQHELCRTFEVALGLFEAEHWVEAAENFSAILSTYPGDGPTRFYLNLARRNAEVPPAPGEGKIVRMQRK